MSNMDGIKTAVDGARAAQAAIDKLGAGKPLDKLASYRVPEKTPYPTPPEPVIKSTVEIEIPTTVQRMTTFLNGKAIPADARVSVGVKQGSTRAKDKHTLQISWES